MSFLAKGYPGTATFFFWGGGMFVCLSVDLDTAQPTSALASRVLIKAKKHCQSCLYAQILISHEALSINRDNSALCTCTYVAVGSWNRGFASCRHDRQKGTFLLLPKHRFVRAFLLFQNKMRALACARPQDYSIWYACLK